jgi:hypothetical protein
MRAARSHDYPLRGKYDPLPDAHDHDPGINSSVVVNNLERYRADRGTDCILLASKVLRSSVRSSQVSQ